MRGARGLTLPRSPRSKPPGVDGFVRDRRPPGLLLRRAQGFDLFRVAGDRLTGRLRFPLIILRSPGALALEGVLPEELEQGREHEKEHQEYDEAGERIVLRAIIPA